MSAALLALLFVLFPPWENRGARVTALPQNEQASYSSQVSPMDKPRVPSTLVPSVQADSAGSSTQPVKPLQLNQPPSSPHQVVGKPKAAEISLATAGNSGIKEDTSGLDSALMGRTYKGSIQVNGFKLDLPAGSWVLLANASVNMVNGSAMRYFLGRIEHKRLIGALRILAVKKKTSIDEGPLKVNGCAKDPRNYYLQGESAEEAVIPPDHQACWFISNWYTTPLQQWGDRAINMTPLERAAAGDMTAKGVTYPQDFLGVSFFIVDRAKGQLVVTYQFNPEAEGISSHAVLSFSESDWYATNIPHFPEKFVYANKLKDWAPTFWPKVKAAFEEAE